MKPEEEFEKWLQFNATLYRGNNAIDCMKAAAMHFLAIGRKQGITEAAEVTEQHDCDCFESCMCEYTQRQVKDKILNLLKEKV